MISKKQSTPNSELGPLQTLQTLNSEEFIEIKIQYVELNKINWAYKGYFSFEDSFVHYN